MKKAILVFCFLAIAGGVFAQDKPRPTFTIGGAVDGIWVPFQIVSREMDITRDDSMSNDDPTKKETVTLMGAGMGRDALSENARIRLFMSGQSAENTIGFNVELRFWPGLNTLGFGDNAKFIWNPTPALHFELGKYVNGAMRGKITDNWFKNFTADSYNEDEIFSQFRGEGWYAPSGRAAFGALAAFSLNGLYLGLSLPGLVNFNVSPKSSAEMATAKGGGLGAKQTKYEVINFGTGEGSLLRVYERAHFAAGYAIPDVGLVRVGWVGANQTFNPDSLISEIGIGTWSSPRVEFAFALDKLVPNLTLDIGFKYHLPINAGAVKTWYTDVYTVDPDGNRVYEQLYEFKGINTEITDWTFSPPMGVSLGAIYDMGKINIIGRIDTLFGGKFENKKAYGVAVDDDIIKFPFEINFHAWPSYTFSNGLSVVLEIGFAYSGAYTAGGETYAVNRDNPDGWNGGFRFGGGAYVQKSLGWMCLLRGGVAYSHGGTVHGVKEDMTVSFPIYFEARF